MKIFGKKLTLNMLFALMLVGIAMAATSIYLSNQAQAKVTVESALVLEVSDDGNTWTEDLDLGGIYSFETIEFQARLTNMADVTIDGEFDVIISNNLSNVDCADFSEVTFDSVDVTSECVDLGATVKFSGVTSIAGLDTHIRNITATFSNVMPTEYQIATVITTP